LEQRLRPEPRLLDQLPLDELAGAVISNREKRADEVAVVVKDVGVEVEDAHTDCTD